MAQGIILAKENDMFYLIQLFLCRSISAKESETASLYLFLVEWKGDHFSGGGEKRGRMTAMCMLTMYKIPQPFHPNLSFKPPTKCTEPLHWSGFDQFSSLRLTNWCTLEYPTNIYLIMTPKAQPADAWPYSMGVVHSHQRSPVLFSEKPPCNSPVHFSSTLTPILQHRANLYYCTSQSQCMLCIQRYADELLGGLDEMCLLLKKQSGASRVLMYIEFKRVLGVHIDREVRKFYFFFSLLNSIRSMRTFQWRLWLS